MRELSHIERFIYSPAFAAFGILFIWAGVVLLRRHSRHDEEGTSIPVNLHTFKGCGFIVAGAFVTLGAILMTILGQTLLPG